MDSNSGGLTSRPVMARRTGWKAVLGLRPRSVWRPRRSLDVIGGPRLDLLEPLGRLGQEVPALVGQDLGRGGHDQLDLVGEQEPDHAGDLGEVVDPLLEQRGRPGQQVQVGLGEGGRLDERPGPGGEVGRRELADVVAVEGVELLAVEGGRVPRHPLQRELPLRSARVNSSVWSSSDQPSRAR